ncbi:hypothetical protein [Williamsia muralis]|uniref:hypothetical protein n=1 Tax=Williamsia marianensis TaxID=85044 RepID=UPI000DE720F4|nr:hypothetical protein [Williamsia marianensis]PVY32280.1 hypothetical protein C7458_10223 [Williamsia marianensis]
MIPAARFRTVRRRAAGGFTDRKASRSTGYTIGSSSYTEMALDTIDPGHPATTLVSGGIQVNYTGNIKVVLDCTTQAAASGYQQLFLPYVNDVASSATANAGTRGVRHAEWTIPVVSGDVVSIYASRTGTSSVDAGATVLITLP